MEKLNSEILSFESDYEEEIAQSILVLTQKPELFPARQKYKFWKFNRYYHMVSSWNDTRERLRFFRIWMVAYRYGLILPLVHILEEFAESENLLSEQDVEDHDPLKTARMGMCLQEYITNTRGEHFRPFPCGLSFILLCKRNLLTPALAYRIQLDIES